MIQLLDTILDRSMRKITFVNCGGQIATCNTNLQIFLTFVSNQVTVWNLVRQKVTRYHNLDANSPGNSSSLCPSIKDFIKSTANSTAESCNCNQDALRRAKYRNKDGGQLTRSIRWFAYWQKSRTCGTRHTLHSQVMFEDKRKKRRESLEFVIRTLAR